MTGWQLFDLEPATGRVADVTGHHSAGYNRAGYPGPATTGLAPPGSATPGLVPPGSATTVLVTTVVATAMPADTGFPRADVENDFQRARRRQVLARLSQRLRREPDDVNLILPFDEVVAALGMTGERKLGLQVIKLDTVVGTVDSTRDFDRRFRPTSSRVRERWERLALAQRRGESIPPIDVYRVGDLHFVSDGHHRVSIALAMGQKTIDAYVTEILTAVPARGIRRRGDLLFKNYERLFRSRVKLPPRPTPRSPSPIPGATRNSARPWRPGVSGSCSTSTSSTTGPRCPGAGSPRSSPRSCACCTPRTWSAPAPTPTRT